MKKPILILLVLFGLSSLAQAQSSSIGLRLGVLSLVSVVYGYDFEAQNRGFGVKAFVSGVAVVGFGGAAPLAVVAGLEGIYRFAIGDFGSSLQLGLGASAGIYGVNLIILAYLQLGIELALGSGWSLTLEAKPLNWLYITQFRASPFPSFSLGVNYRF